MSAEVAGPSPAAVARAVDEVGIRALVAAYADVVNRRTWGELADLFAPDAVVTLDLRDREPIELVGPGAVGEFVGAAIERFGFFEFVALEVRVLPGTGAPDAARVRTWMCELRQDHDGVFSRAFGLYQDDVVRHGDAWRFARRDYQSIARGEGSLDLLGPPRIEG